VKNTRLIFVFELLAIMFTALAIGLFTYYVIYNWLAGGHRLLAYIYNIAFIAIILLFDKYANFVMSKDGFLTAERTRFKHFLAQALFATHFVSFKTALYLFYIIMLIISRVSVLEPSLIDRHQLSFIYSVEYGVVLLIPLDKFLELLTKDDKRILKILSNHKEVPEKMQSAQCKNLEVD